GTGGLFCPSVNPPGGGVHYVRDGTADRTRSPAAGVLAASASWDACATVPRKTWQDVPWALAMIPFFVRAVPRPREAERSPPPPGPHRRLRRPPPGEWERCPCGETLREPPALCRGRAKGSLWGPVRQGVRKFPPRVGSTPVARSRPGRLVRRGPPWGGPRMRRGTRRPSPVSGPVRCRFLLPVRCRPPLPVP